jgi:hypothetical protein
MSTPFIIADQFTELVKKYSGLLLLQKGGVFTITGLLSFSAKFNANLLTDEYSIEIRIPNDYPDSLPSVFEMGNRIPNDFHKNPDKSLCLGAPLALRRTFLNNPSLIGFIENCIIPHLYLCSYKSEFGLLPYGELSHGWQGILEYYQNMFKVFDEWKVLRMLKFLIESDYRAHSRCPCGSRKRLRECHGGLMKNLMSLKLSPILKNDYIIIKDGMKTKLNK